MNNFSSFPGRVLFAHQAPSLEKMAEISSMVKTKKVAGLIICFSNFPGKQQHFSVKAGVLFSREVNFLDKVNLKKVFSYYAK